MNLAFLKFDFPDLEPHEALWLLANDLEAAAYYLEDGKVVGVRNLELAARYMEMRLEALAGMAQASRQDNRAEPASKEAEVRQKRRRR